MATPNITYGAVGNALTSQSLAASGSVSFSITGSTVFESRVTIQNTPGAAVAATRGVTVTCKRHFSTTGATYETIGTVVFQLPSQTASTLESHVISLDTGDWQITLTNLDATNAVTVAGTLDQITSIA